MSFARLLHSPAGCILLVNSYNTFQCDLLDQRDRAASLLGLYVALNRMPTDFEHDDLVREIFRVMGERSYRFQVAAKQQPPGATRIVAVRGLEDLRRLLRDIAKKEKFNRQLRNALAPRPTDAAMMDLATLINRYSQEMTTLTLAGEFNIFFATTFDALKSVERALAGAGSKQTANEIRDRLGLVHVDPISAVQFIPMFAFEATKALGSFSAECRVARPTTIDGFNNKRFRQQWPIATTVPSGSGLTVHLAHGFGPGLPELVSTKVPLKENFVCRYLGQVSCSPVGSDEEFLDFLLQDSAEDLTHMANALDESIRGRSYVR